MFSDFRTFVSVVIWAFIPIYGFLSFMVWAFAAGARNADIVFTEAALFANIYYIFWLVVVARYTYPSKKVDLYAIKDYFPLAKSDYFKVFFITLHQLIYIILIIIIIVYPFIFQNNDYYRFIYKSILYAVGINISIAVLSGIIYIVPAIFDFFSDIYNIFRIFVLRIIPQILSAKLNWKDFRIAFIKFCTPKEKEEIFVKLPENSDDNISENYYNKPKNTASNNTYIPFKSTLSASIKTLADIPKTIITGKKPKP